MLSTAHLDESGLAGGKDLLVKVVGRQLERRRGGAEAEQKERRAAHRVGRS